jgi:uracil-DNA glycosylase
MTQSTPYESGDPSSSICFLGEAPSFEEIRKNQPFVGPAGNLLEQAMHSAQIARSRCYFLNVFETLTKKPRDDASKLVSSDGATLLWTASKGFTEAGKAAAANSLQRLRASKANVIVPLGATALHLALATPELVNIPSPDGDFTAREQGPDKFLNDPRAISKWRGSIITGIDGRKVVPSIHPSFCLRGAYEARYLLISDLRKAKAESTSPDFVPTPRNLLIDPSFAECVDFLKRCLEAPAVDTDIELLKGQVDCFSLALSPHEAISIPLLDSDFEHRFNDTEEAQIWNLYAQIISAPHILKINQNITFDLACLLQLNHIVPAGPVADPMVAHSIVYPFLSKNLGTLCSLYTREPYYKDDGELSDSPSVADFHSRWLYNAKDAAIAFESWNYLEPHLESQGYLPTYNMTMSLVASLTYMMVRGAKLNEKALLKTRAQTLEHIATHVQALEAAMQRPIITKAPKTAAEKKEVADNNAININSPAQLSAYFYKHKKVKPYINKLGKESIDDMALARIWRRDKLEEAKILQEYRGMDKLLGTYLNVGYDADRRLRCSYNIRGTWAGRLSSSQTVFRTGLNMQNIPPNFRGFIVSDEVEAEDDTGNEHTDF